MKYFNRVAAASYLVRSLACALACALLSGSFLLGAVTKVTLGASATPNAADPGVTNVTVVGHGFPSGTIPPANITVTFNPTISGGGPSGNTTANTVAVESGATDAVTFKVPTSIAVSSATSYQVSIAGTTSTGNPFASSNTAVLTVNAPVQITSTSPLPTGKTEINYSDTLTATGGSGQYTWAVSAGTLPAGLTLNTATGVISGQPTTAGTSHFNIKATDSLHEANAKTFALTIQPSIIITTTSPLPTGTVNVNYSETLTAQRGGGHYTWAVTAGSLPSGLTLSTTGVISGQPATAATANFTIQVTGASQASTTKAFAMTVNPALLITTNSPLPAGTAGVNYSQTVTATGGSGTYTWAVSVGSLPAGLTLAAATGAISGQPTTATTANFTIQVTDSNQVMAAAPFSLTINPAASILTVSPNTSNAGLSLQVSITGSYTHFAQGTTVASFGPGIAVGGGAAGQPGPVTVNSPTSATAEIAISASAGTGSQTVTLTTGAEHASLANGFTIQAAIPYISLTTTATIPLATGFSGFNDEYLLDGVEYWDPKWLAAVMPLHPGWIRFPGGTPSMAFDWETAHENTTWMSELEPYIPAPFVPGLLTAQQMTQAKGGACFARGPCVSDYATFLKTLGANGIVSVNGYTDSNPDSIGVMDAAARVAGINIIEWEIDNEPYDFPNIFPTAASYAASAYAPSYLQLHATEPSATAGVFFQGEFLTLVGDYQTWDSGMAAYSPQYWQGVTFHVYPITNPSMAVSDEEQTLNGILAHGTTEYYGSYIQPLVGQNTPVFFTEVNSDGFATSGPFESYIYNGIFLAEWAARMSTIPQVQAVGISALLLPNSFSQGMICAVNDYEDYLMAQVVANPNYSTDTSTNPNTQYQFYYSTSGLAMEVANLAINNSNATWPTTVTGGTTVPIEGYDGNPVPALFAQGYQGTDGTHYLLITNKSASSTQMAIEVDGNVLKSNVTVSYISNASDTAQNTATAQTNVQIVTTTSANPITIGPYSVTRVQW